MGFLNVCYSAAGNWFQVNEVLNVADLATQTVVAAPTAANAQLISTQTAITAIVDKINAIIQKTNLSC